MFTPLRYRSFTLLFVAGTISLTGDWALGVALPITVFQLTHSTVAMGAAAISELLPRILLSSVAGVFADRWDRRRLMIVGDLVLATALLPLLWVHSPGTVWIVYPVTLISSSVTRFFVPAERALLPSLVEEKDLVSANALSGVASDAARLVGPSLGGLIAVWRGLDGVALIDAATFLIAALLISAVRSPARLTARPTSPRGVAPWTALRGDWLEGLAVVRHNRMVATFLAVLSIAAFGEAVMGVMFVVWVKEVVGGTALQLGWFMSAQAVGGLAGGLVIASVSRRVPTLLLAWVAPIVFGLGDIALFSYPLFTRETWVGLFLIACVGLPAAALGAAWTSLLQQSVEDDSRGRVFGSLGTTSGLMGLAGTVCASALGGVLNPVLFLNLAQGGAYLVVGIFLLFALGLVLTTNDATVGRQEPST